MSLSWKQVIASRWTDARQHLQNLGSEWIFRGQRESAWGLTTSLEREALGESSEAVEQKMLRECRRRAHHFLPSHHLPSDSILDWLALMQHHGAPTRLLDWTRSPFVAAFFALEKSQPHGSCAVWCLNADWCTSASRSVLGRFDSSLSPTCDLSEPAVFEKHVLPGMRRLVIPVEPFRMHQRMTAQQGLFTCAGDLDVAFVDNLRDLAGEESPQHRLIKIVIPTTVRNEALYELNRMNIHRGTLFPDIDGFIGSLKQQLVQRSSIQQAIINALHLR